MFYYLNFSDDPQIMSDINPITDSEELARREEELERRRLEQKQKDMAECFGFNDVRFFFSFFFIKFYLSV